MLRFIKQVQVPFRFRSLRVCEFHDSRIAPSKDIVSAGEAITETLVSRDIKHVFSITGSAFLPASDCFETAGIRLVHVQHEQNAGFCMDGYARAKAGAVGVTLNQAGPGASNLLTSLATSYWNHSPVVAITPTVDSHNDGKGVFQELKGQDVVFKDQVKYLGNVNRSDRVTEILGKGLDRSLSEQGPTQVNIPRDFFNASETYKIPLLVNPKPCAPHPDDILESIRLIEQSNNPVILAGAGVGWSATGSEGLKNLAEKLNVPVATTYIHNDVFPYSHPLNVGSLGYFGSRAAMRVVKDADLVIAVGTRLGPFSITPQDGIQYWNNCRALIQVDSDRSRLGISSSPTLPIHSDAGLYCQQLSEQYSGSSRDGHSIAQQERAVWEAELDELTQTTTIPEDGAIAPRKALKVLGDHIYATDSILSTDIGNVSSQMNSYAKFKIPRSYLAPGLYGSCGYSVGAAMGAKLAVPDRNVVALVGDGAFMMNPVCELVTLIREKIPITIVVARNNFWWAEGLNTHLYFGKRYGGTAIDSPSFAKIAQSMGLQGIEVNELQDVQPALDKARCNQSNGLSTLVEVHMTAEPTQIFRADAMKVPHRYLDKYQHLNPKS